MLDDPAEKGANRILERIGLQDEIAGNDVREWRDLLHAFRDGRKTVRRAVIRFVTLAVLAAIVAYTRWPQK